MKEKSKIEAACIGPPSYDVKGGDLFDDIASAASTLLPVPAKEAMAIVLDEMKFVCMAQDVYSRYLLEAHRDVTGESLEGMVDLVLTAPLYNVRNKCSMDKSSHEMFKHEGMSAFVEFACQEMPVWARRQLYFIAHGCSFPKGIRSWNLCRRKCRILKPTEK